MKWASRQYMPKKQWKKMSHITFIEIQNSISTETKHESSKNIEERVISN